MKNSLLISGAILGLTLSVWAAEPAKIAFIAGGPSHGPGDHEHLAGCLLLKSCLDPLPGITSEVHSNGWPRDPAQAFSAAASIVLYSDGGGGNPFLAGDRLETIGRLIDQGVGLVCIHYAVEPTRQKGQKEFLDWIGGCFELNWSVNPTWSPDFREFPNHPIARGLTPFRLTDEWYFHMRFQEGMRGVVPILSAVAFPSTMNRPDGPHEGNPAVRESVKKGELQHMAWAFERPNGGRGFGFTGGHFHRNWGNENFRKVVLNAILWTAKIEVPIQGVRSQVPPQALTQNLDPK